MGKVAKLSLIICLSFTIICVVGNCLKISIAIEIKQEKSTHNTRNAKLEEDVIRIQNIYKLFLNVAKICVQEEEISPESVIRLNYLISKLNHFQKLYSIKYSPFNKANELQNAINNSAITHSLLSEYVFYSNQLRKLNGCQFVNL